MRVKVLGRRGVWVLGGDWSFSYWPPLTWHPLGIREGLYGRRGWWGAASFHRDNGPPPECGDLNAGLVARCIRPKGHPGGHQGIGRADAHNGLWAWTDDGRRASHNDVSFFDLTQEVGS